jgi:isocitrate dehydrogenase (NAD+)
MATINSDIFKPTKFGGKYTVTLIPGTQPPIAISPSPMRSVLNIMRR